MDKEKIEPTLSDHVFPITTFALSNITTGQIHIWEINWKTQQIQKLIQWSTELPFTLHFALPPTNFCLLGQSKFCFQKNKQTLAVWDKETRNEKTIKFKNELDCFDLFKDGSLMVTVEKLVNSMSESVFSEDKSKFCLWNLDQMKKLDRFTLPFHHSIIKLSPRGKFLIVQDIYSFVKLRVWKIKKGKFNFLWKIPIYLNVTRLSLKNTQNLDAKNTLLLTQLQNEKRFQ
ncbi:WD40 repeat domain-containing protein [Candidatus Protochlamydia sp. W-9]|uniref:WD40 repeat domain-containing protein n=1 Tax=Candidatus Protochlamydia sp. W-9 TaxID=1785087 RepID=UPI000A4EF44D|nr:WD40 repeat domain-containing protein [Candidatus Protochlamydia sp. W-9]